MDRAARARSWSAAQPGGSRREVRAVGGLCPWLATERDRSRTSTTSRPSRPTRGRAPTDRLLLYFTSGTTSKPKLVEHTQVSYPVGHLSTMYWIGLQPGDVHLNISSPGLGQARVVVLLRALDRRGDGLPLQLRPVRRGSRCSRLRTHEVTFCAPPTVWRMLIKPTCPAAPAAARGHRRRRAAQPRGDRAGRQAGADDPGRLRADRDDARIGNTPGEPGSSRARWAGRCPACRSCSSTRTRSTSDARQGEGEICLDLAQQPLSLMTGYQGDEQRNAEAMAGGFYHTGDVAVRRRGRLHHLRRPHRRRLQGQRLQDQPVRARVGAHRAPGGRGGRRRAVAGPRAAGGAQGVRRPRRRLRAQRGGGLSILALRREKLAPWQRVRRIEFFELPKTISGKIRRVELRGREEELDAAGAAQPELEWRDDQFPDLRGVTVELGDEVAAASVTAMGTASGSTS